MEDAFLRKCILGNLKDKWQNIVDLVAKVYEVPSALIVKVDYENDDIDNLSNRYKNIEAFFKSKGEDNPFELGKKGKYGTGFYCEEVINKNKNIFVKNALKSSKWCNSVELQHNMIFYCGIPIHFPNGKIFGTMCILDFNEREYSKEYIEALHQFKNIIEGDIQNILTEYELKKKNEELKKLEARYKKIMDIMPEGIILRQDKKIKYLNDSAYKLLGINKDKHLKKEQDEIVNPYYNHNEVASDIINNLDTEEIVRVKEEKIITLDGDNLDVEITSILTEIDSKKYLLNILHDITDKKKAQELEMQLKKEFEYDKLRSEFLSNVSHEFRTPINIIYNSIQLVESYLKDIEIENIEKYNLYIKKNCFRLIKLVNNLIDINKINEGTLTPNIHSYNIVEIVEETVMSALQYIEANGMNAIFDTDVEWKCVNCDEKFIKRIILNLLSNAVKYGEAQGNIYINIYDKGSEIHISVEDEGKGIPKYKQEKMFKTFEQLDKSFIRENEGSGLGLSIVRALTELQGGAINIDSQEGKGAKFKIILPASDSEIDNLSLEENHIDISETMEMVNIEFSDI